MDDTLICMIFVSFTRLSVPWEQGQDHADLVTPVSWCLVLRQAHSISECVCVCVQQGIKWFTGICSFNGGFPGDSVGKETSCSAGDTEDASLIPGLGRSPGGGHGNPLQCSCLEIPQTERPGGLQSTGPQRVIHNWSNWACLHTHLISTISLWNRYCYYPIL